MMRNIPSRMSLPVLLCILLPFLAACAGKIEAHEISGRWDIDWDYGDPSKDVVVYINNVSQSQPNASELKGTGCMRSVSGVMMPLSLTATYDPEKNNYDLIMASTNVPQQEDGNPFVVRFTGLAELSGGSVSDDSISGTYESGAGSGAWSGKHQDKRRFECPDLGESGWSFQGDVYIHRDLGADPAVDATFLEGVTLIVSSAMRVEFPTGEVVDVPPYTDIFIPGVDFVNEFRYLSFRDQTTPVVSEPYKFVLLDILGEPIPGTESNDYWFGCQHGAPSQLVADFRHKNFLDLRWEAVIATPGFDPSNGIGFYQIETNIDDPTRGDYGSNNIISPTHRIPWADFEPDSPGYPDGFDQGDSLSELDDGIFRISIYAFGQPDPSNPGFKHECAVYDSSQDLLMEKQGEELKFSYP